MARDNPFSDYLTKQEFCASVPGGPITERTADRWHLRRIGPPRLKVGRTVLHPKKGVTEWLERRTLGDLAKAS